MGIVEKLRRRAACNESVPVLAITWGGNQGPERFSNVRVSADIQRIFSEFEMSAEQRIQGVMHG
jgi:hypothetical protein